jgi:hypothetical protein
MKGSAGVVGMGRRSECKKADVGLKQVASKFVGGGLHFILAIVRST